MPTGIYVHKSPSKATIEKMKKNCYAGHKVETCECYMCRAARGEYGGAGNPSYRKTRSPATLKKLSESMSKVMIGNQNCKGNLGRKATDVQRRLLSLSHQGQVPWNKGKLATPEMARFLSTLQLGRKQSADTKKKRSLFMKTKWQDPTFRKYACRRRIPSYPETRIQVLITEAHLPYRYVGNGEVWIGNVNPDFIHLTEKKVIEVYGSYQKARDFGTVENYENFRRNLLVGHGYTVTFLNEKDYFGDDWRSRCILKLGGVSF